MSPGYKWLANPIIPIDNLATNDVIGFLNVVLTKSMSVLGYIQLLDLSDSESQSCEMVHHTLLLSQGWGLLNQFHILIILNFS